MSSLASANLCAICMENFKHSGNSACTTTCGHLFHEQCIQTWRISSTKCPICNNGYRSIVKLFLNFDDNKIEGINKLLIESQDIENHFIQLGEQYTIIRRELNNLKNKATKNSSGKVDYASMHLSHIRNDTMGKVRKALKQNNVLLFEVDKKIKRVSELNDEDEKDAPALRKQCTVIVNRMKRTVQKNRSLLLQIVGKINDLPSFNRPVKETKPVPKKSIKRKRKV
uniref:RING-type domain-containing protein n=1 Tax=Glossina palpalis gambiensis TaxID=67801 RepID=A0A1B0B495_9MUSC